MGAARRAQPHHAVALLVFAALAGGFWIHRIYVQVPSRSTFLSADLIQYFYPSTVFLHDELQAGRFPTWNPYQMAGFPFLAAQITGVLYPPHLLLAASLSPARALEAHAVLHLVAAGFFTWLFARRIGLAFWPSLASGAAFMLSSEMVQRTYNTPYLSTAIWLPALFWAAHGLLSESRLRWAVALAVTGALSFLGGNTQGTVYAAQTVAAFWALGLWVLTPAGRRLRTLGLTILAGGLALALSAPQLLPTLELAREGARGLPGLSLEEANEGAMSPWTLLFGALGRPRGNVVTPLALALVPFGIADRDRRWLWTFFLLAAVLGALFMMGAMTPVWRIYYALPLGNLFRIPARASMIWGFCLAVLAGLGVQGLTSWAHRRWPGTPAVSTSLGALLALLIAGDSYARARLSDSIPILWEDSPYGAREFLARRKGYERVFIEDFHRVQDPATQSKLGTLYRRFVVPDYEPLMPRAYAEFFGQDRLWHGRLNLHSSKGSSPVSVRSLDLMSVRHYVAPIGTERVVRRLFLNSVGEAPTRRGHIWIASRTRAVPRVYAVGSVRVDSNPDRVRRRVQSLRFDPRREAIVSRGEALDNDSPASERVASISSFANDEVVIDASCADRCLLVLTDLHYPGWEAWVDGRPAEIVPTNIAFRGLFLDAGTHRVVYRYRPKSLWLGLGCAAAGIVGVAVLGSWLRRRGRHGQATAG